MAAETQYTANTGMAQIAEANSALDGTGAVTVLTAASGGTLIKHVRFKSIVNTTPGMLRLFAYDGTNTKIITEVFVPEVTKGSRDPAFEAVLPLDYVLKASGILKATTQNAQTFNVIAEGLDFTYYTTSVRPESTKYTANNGFATIDTANTSLTGSGTVGTDIWDVLTAASNGTIIQSVVIKALVATTPGMVRLFIYDGTNTRLLMEIPVPYVTPSGTARSFSRRIDFNGRDFALKSGWKLRATTEVGGANGKFNVIAEGLDWAYPA